MDKNKVIHGIYYDLAGYGSINTTYQDAKQKDKSITLHDVKEWFQRNIEQKRKIKGYNSFVANGPNEEYQADLFFVSDLKQDAIGGLLIIDIFTKYCQVIPIYSKTPDEILKAFKLGFQKMGNKPKCLYTDNEGSFVSNIFQNFLKDENINHIITLSHAPVAERMIRTYKKMLYDRLGDTGPYEDWTTYNYPILLVYNHKMKHRMINMTPSEARKHENHLTVKLNLEMKAKHKRLYPDIKEGDHVKVFKKKDKLDKERISNWSREQYIVSHIIEQPNGQEMYKLEHKERPVIRSELLLIH